MKKKMKAVISVLLSFVILSISCYVCDYYRATDEAAKAVLSATGLKENILVFEAHDQENQTDSECGLIFYPGGKVEYTAYAPLMEACAEEGITCVLMHMPWNLAVLDVNAAEGIQEDFPDITKWYMAGHSLGGSMAATYLGDNAEAFEGLVLLASYSTEDLSDTDLKVLSIYGTEDHVLNRDKYLEYEENLPEDYMEEIIVGGCHAYFGNYGEQEGDGTAYISVEEQQEIAVEEIKKFVK